MSINQCALQRYDKRYDIGTYISLQYSTNYSVATTYLYFVCTVLTCATTDVVVEVQYSSVDEVIVTGTAN